MPQCVTLWVGPRLGPVERACLRSVINQGHPLTLYCYSVPDGVPSGVEVRDAAKILPAEAIIRHQSGSVALFANWFRYELQRLGAGTWVDCDVYLLAPLDGRSPYLFGEEAPGRINNGVLRLPSESPLLPSLIALFDEDHVPPWLPTRAWVAAKWRLWRYKKSGLANMPWGSTGPSAISYLARRFDVSRYALEQDVLYPSPWQNALWICDANIALEQVITDKTVSVHLWNECIKHVKDLPAKAGSFLARLQHEGI